MKQNTETLIILGAGARAAAFSARRANWKVVTGDLFADLDTASCARATRIQRYPDDLKSVALATPRCAWLYTGALENYPRLVDQISQHHTLYGNSAKVLQEVRNPILFSSALCDVGLLCPAIKSTPEVLSGNHTWLKKPWKSGGGMEIEFCPENDSTPSTDHYYQQYIEGPSYAAVYLASAGRAVLLGVSRQLIDADWTGAGRFQYAGSLGPVPLTQNQQKTFEQIGNCLSSRFSLVGLFGVDAVICDEQVWPVEVNPRYTASVEILERALGHQAVALHVAACRDGRLPAQRDFFAEENQPSQYFGKAILYATKPFTISKSLVLGIHDGCKTQAWPAMADIPQPKTDFEPGQPVLTLFASADSLQNLEPQLRKKTTHLRRLVENQSTEKGETKDGLFMKMKTSAKNHKIF